MPLITQTSLECDKIIPGSANTAKRITTQLNTVINLKIKNHKSIANVLLSTQKSTPTNIQPDGHDTDHRAIIIKTKIDPEILHILDTILEGKIFPMTGCQKKRISEIATREDPQATPEDKTILIVVDTQVVITNQTTEKIGDKAPIREISHELDLIAEIGKILDIGLRNNTTGHDGQVCTSTNERK